MFEEIFKDLKVVELASVLAGPAVGMFFSELGANVIKIENKLTNGDVTRKWKLPQEKNETTSSYYHSINWNKKSLFLNLSKKEDLDIALSEIINADILISNFKKGSALKLNLDYQSIYKLNPEIIYASINAYGEESDQVGFDAMVQADSGWISMTGPKDGQACKMPVAIIDLMAAHQLKEGILIALIKKFKTGKGSKVTASLFESSIASLANQASGYLNTGHTPVRMGTMHPTIAPYGDLYTTKDKVELMIAVGTDRQFQVVADILEIDDHSIEELKRNQARVIQREKLNLLLQKAFYNFESDSILKAFRNKAIPIAIIKSLDEVFEHPLAKGMILEDEDNGTLNRRVKTISFKIK